MLGREPCIGDSTYIALWAHEFPHALSSLLFSSLLFSSLSSPLRALCCSASVGAFVSFALTLQLSAQVDLLSSGAVVEKAEPIGGLELQHEPFLKLRPELEAIFQGYYEAVETGDFDKALTYYAWGAVNGNKADREAARQNALDAARLVKQQVDHKGGVRRVAVYTPQQARPWWEDSDVRSVAIHGIFKVRDLEVVIEVEFNDGTRDLSPVVPMTYEKGPAKDDQGAWKLEVVTVSMKIPPPLVGQREILATFDTIYRAALADDLEQMRALSYEEGLFLSLKEDKPEEREKRISRIYDVAKNRIQTAARLNDGLVSIDIPRMQETTVYVYTKPGEAPIAIASAMTRRSFGNGKSEVWQTSFFLDRDGRWKANPNTLR